MKKLSLMAVLLLAAGAIYAQRSTTQFGIKAGVNLANLEIENTPDGDHRTGFHVGGLAHIHVSPHIAVQPELVFSTQGREQDFGGVNYRTNLSYINLPVLLQYMAGGGFRLETGPQLGILVNAENKAGSVETDVKNSYKTPDVSWAFGAGYLTSVGLGFDARYNLGLSNINDASSAKVRNRVWQIGLFYQFMNNPVHRRR
ncbi:MAG TPA: porin family protein [Chitinophagaceae bacterium]|nr:porin family protein [Chitinophagaceae bacterium]